MIQESAALRRSADSLKALLKEAYQRGRREGREDAAKVADEWKELAGLRSTRCVLEILADHIRRSLPQEGG